MSGSEGADSLRDCVGEVHLIVTGRFAVQASAEEEIPRRSFRLVGLNLPLSLKKFSRLPANAESDSTTGVEYARREVGRGSPAANLTRLRLFE